MPEKKTKQEKTVMYVGPAIAGVVAYGTVFKNGLPGQLQQAVKEEPALNRMLVEIGAVCEARKELRKETSGLSICYRKADEDAKKRGAVK